MMRLPNDNRLILILVMLLDKHSPLGLVEREHSVYVFRDEFVDVCFILEFFIFWDLLITVLQSIFNRDLFVIVVSEYLNDRVSAFRKVFYDLSEAHLEVREGNEFVLCS
jgi:hypothetical protein